MKKLFEPINLFIVLTMVAAIVALSFLGAIEKGDEIIWFNNHHNTFSDNTFKLFTMMAEGYFFVPVIIAVWIHKKWQAALAIILSLALTGIIVQILKRLVFYTMHRPAEVMGKMHSLRIIDGVEPLYHFSFPSGHASIGFALMFSLASIYTSRDNTLLFMVIAILIAVSRMYLLQHFLNDVVAGGLLGLTVAWIVHRFFTKFAIQNKVQ